MSNINTVALSGNLTRDMEYVSISDTFGKAKSAVAVNRSRKNGEGEYVDEVSYFDVEILGQGFGQLCTRKLKKGDSVTIQGRLEQQRWKNDADENRSKVVVIVDGFDGGKIDSEGFFRSKDEDNDVEATPAAAAATEAAPSTGSAAAAADDDDIPF